MTAEADREAALVARVAELEARLARAETTVSALRDVGLALGSTVDLDQLLELILRQITQLLEADRATLYLVDEPRGRLVSRIVIGDELRQIEVPSGKGIAGHVARSGRAIRIRDAYRDKRFLREWDELTGYRTRSILAVPMKNHVGRTIGVIQVLNKLAEEGEFSAHDEELLFALATQAAVSIDNSRLFLSVIQKNMQLVETKEQLERRVADLKLLFDLESATGHAASMEDLARAVAMRAAEACGAEAGAILVDEGEAGLWLYFVDAEGPEGPDALDAGDAEAEDGADGAPGGPGSPDGEGDERPDAGPREPEGRVVRLAHKRGEGILGRVMSYGEAVCVPDPEGQASPLPSPGDEGAGETSDPAAPFGRIAGLGVRSAIAVPLEGDEGENLGALALFNAREPLGFGKDERSLLRLVSANAATALRLFLSRVEQERGERLRAIGHLLSGVMHDMRTPLTVISGYVQLMADADSRQVRREHMSLVLKQFDLLSAMQREVLEFARGERSVLIRKVYLAKFFGDIEKQLQQELAGTPVRLTLELEDRGTARFDEAKMTRLVHNLARNAVEAMSPEGGTLTLRVRREGEELVVSVSDTGSGVPEEIRGRLFQSFVTAGKKAGTGLGLAIVKKIVDEHAGSIAVDSSPRGATFTVRLPQAPQKPPAEAEPRRAKQPARPLAPRD